MDSLVNDKQTYEVLKKDPTPALQRKLSNKLLTLKKTDKIDFRRYNRLKCSFPQLPQPPRKLSYLGKRSESRENANATQAVWTTKTTQTQHTYAAQSFFLWVPDLSTV